MVPIGAGMVSHTPCTSPRSHRDDAHDKIEGQVSVFVVDHDRGGERRGTRRV